MHPTQRAILDHHSNQRLIAAVKRITSSYGVDVEIPLSTLRPIPEDQPLYLIRQRDVLSTALEEVASKAQQEVLPEVTTRSTPPPSRRFRAHAQDEQP